MVAIFPRGLEGEGLLDESLKEFEAVYPACGSSNSAIKLTLSPLEEIVKAKKSMVFSLIDD